MIAISIGLVALAVLMGSFPTAYLMGRWVGKNDIRDSGSRNPGAINAYRQYGKSAGLFVVLVDAGKGALAIYIGRLIGAPSIAVYIAAIAVTLGHNFNPFFGFRGGKGAATVLGIAAITVWQITAITLATGGVMIALTRRTVTAILGVFFVLNGLTIFTGEPLGVVLICVILSLIVAGTHFGRQYPQLSVYVRQRRWRRVGGIDTL